MSDFDIWLVDRLTVAGCLIYGDKAPDIPGALSLFQRSIGLPETFLADEMTIHYLRQNRSGNPESGLIFFDAVPSDAESLYRLAELAA